MLELQTKILEVQSVALLSRQDHTAEYLKFILSSSPRLTTSAIFMVSFGYGSAVCCGISNKSAGFSENSLKKFVARVNVIVPEIETLGRSAFTSRPT